MLLTSLFPISHALPSPSPFPFFRLLFSPTLPSSTFYPLHAFAHPYLHPHLYLFLPYLLEFQLDKPYISLWFESKREIVANFSAFEETPVAPAQSKWKMYATHGILFVLTFLTTTLAGVQWLNNSPLELRNFPMGLTYSFLILLMLGSHEFGHRLWPDIME